MTEAERIYWDEVVCGIVHSHIAHHDAIKAQKLADEAKARAIQVARQVEIARKRAYRELQEAQRIEKDRLAILAQIEEQQAAEAQRLEREAQQAELERLQRERENDPMYVRVRNFWNQSLAPINRQFNIAA